MNHPMVYFFLALTAVLAATANAAGPPVLDTDGDLIFHGSYYVLPVVRGQGGGLTLSGRGGESCPLDVGQESSEVDDGIPVKFSNWLPTVPLLESLSINIETVVGATICVQSTYWKVGEFDEKRGQYFVVAGPKPEEYSVESFFQIKKAEDGDYDYKIVFCPEDCIDVGIFVDEKGVRRLALSSKPFLVRFKKAIDGSSKTKST